uniref:Rhodanese domain-containing protein n=1 Tax=Romanomermis culicivorax TaxID=13658 RepID=A0A915JL41_ROMCU
MRLLKDAQFGVVSFYGVNDELGNKCGPNGLPLTPSSVQMGIRICNIYNKRNLPDIIRQFLHFVEKNLNSSAFKFYVELVENLTGKKLDTIDPKWLEVIEQCLMIHPSKRPTAQTLTKLHIFDDFACKKLPYYKRCYAETFLSLDRTSHLTYGAPFELGEDVNVLLNEPIKCRPIDEVYYLWKIAGSNIENILTKKGLLKSQPSIVTLPNTLHSCDSKIVRSDSSACFVDDLFVMSQLPKVVKEKDIQYQLVRMVLFSLLIDAYPFKKSIIWHESRIDIPPVYRGLVWCTLLDVTGDIKSEYDMIDKETATTTDRQIEVDIPRCHQYDELLSSPESHQKFKRVLKAWVLYAIPWFLTMFAQIDIERCVSAAIKVFRETPKSAFYRQYMPPDAMTKMKQKFVLEDQRGVMEPLTLAQLKAEHCPRLFANDLITIQKAKENGTCTPSFDVLCVDIRLFEEFAKGAFPYSINLPHNLLFIDGKFSLSNVACDKLKNHKSKLICVIGSNADDRRSLETAEHLMRNGYSRVTILHKGIDVLRQLQALTVA